jgi:RES domain-containing protein
LTLTGGRPPRPQALLDAIEAESLVPYRGPAWRVVTDGSDVLRPSRAGGRWDDGTFDVLYTSTDRDGALAESYFHATGAQPLPPSKPVKRLFELAVELDRVLDLTADGKLAALGVNMAAYGRLSYLKRTSEYPSLQQIGEAAFFYGYEAILVPNARWPASNVVVFTENAPPGCISIVADEIVDLIGWGRANAARGR